MICITQILKSNITYIQSVPKENLWYRQWHIHWKGPFWLMIF